MLLILINNKILSSDLLLLVSHLQAEHVMKILTAFFPIFRYSEIQGPFLLLIVHLSLFLFPDGHISKNTVFNSSVHIISH